MEAQRDQATYLSSHSSEVEAIRLENLPKMTQLRCRSTESLGNFPKFTHLRYVRMACTGTLAKITELRSKRTERPGNMPKITQLSYGSTDKLGYLPPMGWVQSQKGQNSAFVSKGNHSISQYSKSMP